MAGDPPGTSAKRVLLGELLVQSKVITPEQLGEVLSSPRDDGKKLGQVLLERGWVTEAQLTQTLSLQLSVPWVSLYHIDFSRQLLNRVSRELAEQCCLIPIFVRHVKGQGETLYVAMDDPTNEAALVEVSRIAGLPTKPMIASASDIRSAIRVYYGDPVPTPSPPLADVPVPTPRDGRAGPPPTVPDAPRVPPPPPPKPAAKPAARRSRPAVEEQAPPTTKESAPSVATAPAAAAPAAASGGAEPTAAGASGAEAEPPKKRPRMVSLTLLDGTTIQLPAKKRGAKAPETLTGRDFVGALRAAAHGADASEVLGDQVRWEPIVAALLSLMLKKGLIADWEFVEELRKS